MNYQKIYDNLISYRKANPPKITQYCEKHHITPRSMGGSNFKENIVSLTGREHFIAHLLLYKIHKNKEMGYALWLMACTGSKKYGKVNSRLYEKLRAEHVKRVLKRNEERGFSKLSTGVKQSDEWVRKRVESRKKNSDKWHSDETL